MADAPQGVFRFAGVKGLFSATFTLQRGLSPSVCTMEVAPISGVLRVGPLLIEYGAQRFTFRDCVVDKIEAVVDDSGFTSWRLTILDRRWKWRGFGEISGKYNERWWDDDDPTTFNLRELLKKCFDALGETRVELGDVPEAYPQVDWDYTEPVEALGDLLDKHGLEVVLGTDDRIRVVQDGKGASLPRNALLHSYTETIDPPELPDKLVVVCEPTRYQLDQLLEPVGLDLDGTIKPIEQLSYKPSSGGTIPPSSSTSIQGGGTTSAWVYTDPAYFSSVSDPKARELARSTVFRWYRVKAPFKLPGKKETIEKLEQVLPLDTLQVETGKDEAGLTRRLPAVVYGVFYNRQDGAGAYYSTEERNLTAKPLARYEGTFTIDADNGIVKFNEPVYQLTVDASLPGGRLTEAAHLRLRTAVNVRDAKTGKLDHHLVEKSVPGPKLGTKPRYLKSEIVRDLYWKFTDRDSFEVVDNKEDVERRAKAELDGVIATYRGEKPAAASYQGFVPISPDGAIRQVSWTISGDGTASTRATVQMDQVLIAPTEKELKLARRLAELATKRATKRAEREGLRRVRR